MIYAPKSRSVSNWYGFEITSKIHTISIKHFRRHGTWLQYFSGFLFWWNQLVAENQSFCAFSSSVSRVEKARARKRMFRIAMASFRNICSKYSQIVEENWGNDWLCQAMLAIRQWTMWFDILIGWIIMCVALNLGQKCQLDKIPKIKIRREPIDCVIYRRASKSMDCI